MKNIIIDKEKLISSDIVYGCYKRFCHPKFKSFVIKHSRGRCLINIDLIIKHTEKMFEIMQEISKTDKKILFIGTKKRIMNLIQELIGKTNHFYMNQRWIGGLLTNFNVAHKKRNLKFLEMQKDETMKEIVKRPKKEQMQFKKEVERLEKTICGVIDMKKLPDYIFLIDAKNEFTALTEAKSLNIPVFAITQMNLNPQDLEAYIPANDGSEFAIRLLLEYILSPFEKKENKNIDLSEENIEEKKD